MKSQRCLPIDMNLIHFEWEMEIVYIEMKTGMPWGGSRRLRVNHGIFGLVTNSNRIRSVFIQFDIYVYYNMYIICSGYREETGIVCRDATFEPQKTTKRRDIDEYVDNNVMFRIWFSKRTMSIYLGYMSFCVCACALLVLCLCVSVCLCLYCLSRMICVDKGISFWMP